MKLPRVSLLIVSFVALFASALFSADSSSTPAGYWAGEISTPDQALSIAVELSQGGDNTWQGTIDIPMQGVRGFKLTPVKVDGSAVQFAMPGIPGDPSFSGKLADDAKSISGNFSQGNVTLSFRLERKPKPAPNPNDAMPTRGVPGEGLAGKWRGSIAPMPNIQLRLELELVSGADGKVGGVLISLDQGSPRIPISSLTETEGNVRFETPSVHGSFVGKLNTNGSEIAGDWTQGGRSTPLVFKRLPL